MMTQVGAYGDCSRSPQPNQEFVFTAMQTVGAKGLDGFAIVRVTADH
jgi:hypothetical protein